MAPAVSNDASTQGCPSRAPGSGLLGRTLGGTYRVLGIIDHGGMGIVYEGEHLRLGRPVAVKVLPAHLAGRADVLQRFRQEADLVSALSHPNVVSVLDFDVTEQGEPYIVMERLSGESLAARLDREKRIPCEEAVEILLQVASALCAAHRAGIVHRDLKPSNIFLSDSDDAPKTKLIDFGIGRRIRSSRRITLAGRIVGTPDYMAPEQAMGVEDIDGRADQYSLALVAYEMLSGEQPFGDGEITEVLGRVLVMDIPPLAETAPHVPAAVASVIEKGLQKQREDRFADIEEFASALRTVSARPPSSQIRTRSRADSPKVASRRVSPAFELSSIPLTGNGGRSGGDGSAFAKDSPWAVALWLERARVAFSEGKIAEAAVHARTAVELASQEPGNLGTSLLEVAEPLLKSIFRIRFGGGSRRVALTPQSQDGSLWPSSPRSAFLLSRLEDGMSVEEVVAVAAMPKVEALARLSGLVSSGVVSLAP